MRDILDPDELVRLASTDEARSSAAELTRLEHLASAIAAENTGAALDVAARLESARGDGACWIRAVLLEACGRFEEAAAAQRCCA